VWADVITVLPHVIHEFYGDRDVLEKTYRAMRRWVGWFDDRTRDGLALIGGFGDWVSLEATPPEFCGAAYYVYSSRLLAESAELLGHTQEARRDRERAEQAAEAFHRHFYRPEHQRYEPDTQTAQAFPLALDITPPAERQAVADHLAESVKARDAKPATGFIGTAFLLPVLSRYGHLELAGRVLNTDAYPSLGYMLERRGDHGLGAVELRQGGAGHELA
jgi:alpha-L-rhamnosidase